MENKSAKLVQKLLKTIDDEVNRFNSSIPDYQEGIYKQLQSKLKQLETNGSRLKSSAANIRLVNEIIRDFEKLIDDPAYQKNLSDFTKAFNVVGSLQAEYFSSITSDFKVKPVLRELQLSSIEATVNSLTEAGIAQRLSPVIKSVLLTSITSGGDYPDLLEQVRNNIVRTDTGEGSLERYAKQITTDSLNQFTAQYSAVVTDDLGLEWFEYVGSNLTTTRPWCEYMTKKRWIHRSELSTVINSNIDGVKICSFDIPCSKKTELPAGMIAGTNPDNLRVNRGGYNCGHQLIPVTKIMVPEFIRARISD